ncbi:MAG TPA: FMN-binding protein [Thermoguttaceae bacterium]|nr:FMN-binding protein [Thermoguttaceae bacterium]
MMTDNPRQPGSLRQAWLVILLALLYGGALAATQTTLGPRIAENQRRETYRVIPTLVAVDGAAKVQPVTLALADGKKQEVFRVVADDGATAGWVLPAHGQGFQDRIDLLIGVTPDVATILGLYILDQKDTPNLGSLITEEPYLGQYRGMPTDPKIVVVTSAPTTTCQIRSVTGATISSTSVAEIVNRTIESLKTPIRRWRAENKP